MSKKVFLFACFLLSLVSAAPAHAGLVVCDLVSTWTWTECVTISCRQAEDVPADESAKKFDVEYVLYAYTVGCGDADGTGQSCTVYQESMCHSWREAAPQ